MRFGIQRSLGFPNPIWKGSTGETPRHVTYLLLPDKRYGVHPRPPPGPMSSVITAFCPTRPFPASNAVALKARVPGRARTPASI